MNRTISGRIIGGRTPKVGGSVMIPASKSHTIRALLIAAFAKGRSRIRRPLESEDARSCRRAVEVLGARVTNDGSDWLVDGFGSRPAPPQDRNASLINVGNSGTTLYLASALAALSETPVMFDGDHQIRNRSAAPLLDALKQLGVHVENSGTRPGCAPFSVQGPIQTGDISIDCPVSQYLSALLLAAPLIPASSTETGETRIRINSLNEAPYVELTLDWLKQQDIRYSRKGWDEFTIPAGQAYRSFDAAVPADWSSAAFFMQAAAVTGGSLLLKGPDLQDSQGDKAVADMLEVMGCRTESHPEGIIIYGGSLQGAELDLNATPDALPALAALACFARGETRLVNVPQARMKETDRIAVMARELSEMGADISELPDGLIIRGRRPTDSSAPLKGTRVNGHGDHRVVMALATAALGAEGNTEITGTEAADITFPGFFRLLETAVTE